ncbi:mannosyltransferase-like protein, partial [Leptomonas seymouri]
MRFMLKRRTQPAPRADGARVPCTLPQPSDLPSSVFPPVSRCSRRCLLRFYKARMLAIPAALIVISLLMLAAVLIVLPVFFAEAQGNVIGFLYDFLFPAVPVRARLHPSVAIAPTSVQHGATLPLLVPVVEESLASLRGTELLQELLYPLLASEAALCYRADNESGVRVVLHAVVVGRIPAGLVQSAVRGVLMAGWSETGTYVGAGAAGGELTPGSMWRSWELSMTALRAALRLPHVNGGSGARCLGDVMTVVARVTKDRGAAHGEGPAITLESLVDAGLRTRGGSLGSHFLVLPSFLGASRMAYTEPDDEAEERHAGTGLVDALLQTAMTRNGGRVAAVQCTILENIDPKEATRMAEGAVYPPEELSREQLHAFQVLDKGGMAVSTHNDMMLMPLISRRMHGYLAIHQRSSWEEKIDVVSLHCGIFSRALYNAVGGLAAALTDSELNSAVKDALRLPPNQGAVRAVLAADRGGWVLTLRMQEMYPDWQMWNSRGVAVLRDSEVAVRECPAVKSMHNFVFSLLDIYGASIFPTVTRLQVQRIAVPWRTRGMANTTALWTGKEEAMLPPVLNYVTDFEDACCGLNREAMGYIRPLMERYSIRVTTARRVCPKPGDAILSVPYSLLDGALWGSLSMNTSSFFRQRHTQRARIH